jgi:hypothetical protein
MSTRKQRLPKTIEVMLLVAKTLFIKISPR